MNKTFQDGGMDYIIQTINDRRRRWYEEAEEIRQTIRRNNALTRIMIENIRIINSNVVNQYFQRYQTGNMDQTLEDDLKRELGYIQEWQYLTDEYVEYFLYTISPELGLDGGDINFVKNLYQITVQLINNTRPLDFVKLSNPGEDAANC
jgi:hypothetical protein